MWILLSYIAWGISAVLVAWMMFDWFQTDTSHDEAMLTSSREGELEAITQGHKL